MKPEFLNRFSKKPRITYFMTMHPVGAELFHADRQTNGQTDMIKLTVTFCNFADAPNNMRVNGNTTSATDLRILK
jgi:hypothetical protein